MPKRKRAPRPHTAHPAPGDRDGHTLTATVGDVLEHMHTDAAIELLYAQDNLAAGRPLNDPTAMHVETAARVTVVGVDSVTVGPATATPAASDGASPGPADGSSPVSPPTSRLRLLSPTFVVKASIDAVHELLGGVRRARRELADATVRARHCFTPARSTSAV